MPSEETRRVLKVFGVAVTNLEDAIDRHAPVPEIMKWDAEGADRTREVLSLVALPARGAGGLRMTPGPGAGTCARERARAMLTELEPLYRRVRERAAARRAVRVFYPIWRRPWMTIGADTYVHDLLSTCGGANV